MHNNAVTVVRGGRKMEVRLHSDRKYIIQDPLSVFGVVCNKGHGLKFGNLVILIPLPYVCEMYLALCKRTLISLIQLKRKIWDTS